MFFFIAVGALAAPLAVVGVGFADRRPDDVNTHPGGARKNVMSQQFLTRFSFRSRNLNDGGLYFPGALFRFGLFLLHSDKFLGLFLSGFLYFIFFAIETFTLHSVLQLKVVCGPFFSRFFPKTE